MLGSQHCRRQDGGTGGRVAGGLRVHDEAELWPRLRQHTSDIGLVCQMPEIRTMSGFQIVHLAVTVPS